MIKVILVLGAGRNGSTWLMSLLGGHPAITFDKRYPYESTYISYFAKLARVPTMDRSAIKDTKIWSRQDILSDASPILGPIPFKRGYVPPKTLSQNIFDGVWRAFSETLFQAAQDRGDVAPVYYAEKTSGFAVQMAETIPGARKIHLLRDPRDVLISSRAFNRKRGKLSFGWTPDDTDMTFARRKIPQWKARLQTLADLRDASSQEMVVRYEDLVGDLTAEAKRISDFIGLDLDPAQALPTVSAHQTAATTGVSVERWRTELDAETQELFTTQMGEQLELFSYRTKA